MNTDGTGFNTCKECHKTESLWNHTTTEHKEGEQLEDRRNVGESSCKFGDGIDQRAQSLMFMMMMMMMRSVRKVAKSDYQVHHIRLSAGVEQLGLTGRILVPFYIRDFPQNMLRKLKIGCNRANIWGSLHEDPSTFMKISRWIFHGILNVPDEYAEKIKKYFVPNTTFPQ